MIAVEDRPELEVHSSIDPELRVERTDISFQDLDAERVRIRVKVHNDGASRSKPAFMTLESAPLGAFVPWQPLAALSVPALEAGEARELTVDVKRPRPTPLGGFDRVPPRRILAAVNAPDHPSRPNSGLKTLLGMMIRPRQTGSNTTVALAATVGNLAPDLMDLLGQGQPHWAGNINVFVNRQPVERHMAKALRVYAGRTNLAMFVVGGSARPDAYAFDIVGLNPDWRAVLFNLTNSETLVVGSADRPIRETEWIETPGNMVVVLATRPPDNCKAGNVEIHVTRRSCGETAIVEFDLDPSAQGTGCYTI